MLTPEKTLSLKTQAQHLFTIPDGDKNRRNRRTGEPVRAVNYQLRRVYDYVASEAIVLCDQNGQQLSGVGDQQLCKLLGYSIPAIFSGDSQKVLYSLKTLDLIRPGIDCSHISMWSIPVPHKSTSQLFVASVSESTFNAAGVYHANAGVRRILGIPTTDNVRAVRQVSSRDRLSYDVERALRVGYHEFYESALAQELRIPRRFFRPTRASYLKALEVMLERVNWRLRREGMVVDMPGFMDRFLNRGTTAVEGYRAHVLDLPIRIAATERRIGTLSVNMTVYERHFEIPKPPTSTLHLN